MMRSRTALIAVARAAAPTLPRSFSLIRPLLVPSSSSSTFTPHRSLSSTSHRYATSTSPTSFSFDPQEKAAQDALDDGSVQLELGNLEAAEEAYKKSLSIKETAIGFYNLGVVQYQQQDLPSAIASFKSSLLLSPASVPEFLPDPSAEPVPLTPSQIILSDTHTNLGAAYILSTPPRPDLALEHLQNALMINPDDGECCYNLAAVLEATGELEEAKIAYEKAEALGIERAKVNIRNINAKILGQRLKEEEEKRATADKDGSVKTM